MIDYSRPQGKSILSEMHKSEMLFHKVPQRRHRGTQRNLILFLMSQ